MLLALFLPALAAAAGLPAEPDFAPLLWSFRNVGQPWRMEKSVGRAGKPGADIHLLEAWKIQDEAPDVTVAVIDGGFSLSHPDLAGELVLDKAYSTLTPDRKIHEAKTSLEVHGNLVAGIIGANGLNAIGVTGISRRSRILPIEVVPEVDSEKDSDVAEAIRYAVSNGARVINASFGKPSTSDAVRDAIAFARDHDVLLVAGAGNDGKDTESFWPAAYSRSFDNVISVAATDRDDHLWEASNFGPGTDIAAPGSEIFSTGMTGKDPSLDVRVDYSSAGGTSMAAPHVTGVAALMLEVNPALKPADLKRILMASADVLPTLKGKVKAGGRLNAARALAQARGGCDFAAAKKILARTKKGYSAEWTIPDSPALLAPFTAKDAAYDSLTAWFRSKTKLDWRGILENQIKVVEGGMNEIGDEAGRASMRSLIADDKLVLAGQGGEVRPFACLESIPYREYLKVVDLKKYPQEFNAVVLKKDGIVKILGDFYRAEAEPGDPTGVGESAAGEARRKKLEAAGWALFAHIHDHTFVFGNDDIGGEVCPSPPDVENYKELKPSFGVVTNGFSTIWISPADLTKY